MQLEQVETLHAQAPQRELALLAQVGRSPAGHPLVGPRAQQARLGGHPHATVGVQRPRDQLLGDLGPVGVRGVDKIDTKLGQATQQSDTLIAALRLAPDAFAGHAPCAEAEAMAWEQVFGVHRPKA
jgi:hypothetical protein